MRLHPGVIIATAALWLAGCSHGPDPRALEHVQKAKVEYREGDLEAAAEELTTALSYNPDCASAHFLLGVIYDEEGMLIEAAREYGEAAAAEEGFFDAHLLAAEASEKIGFYEDALVHYRALAALRPGSADVANSLGACCFRMGDYEEAAEAWTRAISLTPNFAPGHANLGSAYWRLGDYDAALAEFEKALEINPASAMARAKLCYTLMTNMRAYGEAIPVLVEGLTMHPDDIRFLSLLGLAYSEVGQQEVARGYHEAALAVEPDHLELMGNLALHYAFMGVELERAVDLAEEAVERRPESSLHLSTLAYVYVRDGRLEQAREAIDEGLALGEEMATVRYVESLLLAQEGEEEAALDALADALETDGLIAYRAAREPLLACLRDDPDFRALLEGKMETPLSD